MGSSNIHCENWTILCPLLLLLIVMLDTMHVVIHRYNVDQQCYIYVHILTLYLKICNSSENVSTIMLWKILLVHFLLISFICTSILNFIWLFNIIIHMLIERDLLAVKNFFLNQIKYLLIRNSNVLQFGSRTILSNWMLLVGEWEIWRNREGGEGGGGNIPRNYQWTHKINLVPKFDCISQKWNNIMNLVTARVISLSIYNYPKRHHAPSIWL